MKKILIAFLLILIVIFSFIFFSNKDNTIENEDKKTVVVNENPKPSYLTVYNLYKEAGLQNKCEDFGETIEDEPHETHWQVYPYKIEDDMEILNAKKVNDGWEFEVSCSIKASYQLNAVTHLYEDFEKNLGIVKYTKK